MNLEFTGERFVPSTEVDPTHYEHVHRYIFANQFVNGKKVLDLACGEGYGAKILSENAVEVTGIDIDKTTIESIVPSSCFKILCAITIFQFKIRFVMFIG